MNGIRKELTYDIVDQYGIHLEIVKPREGIVKLASEISDECRRYISKLEKSDTDLSYVLSNAVGSGEYYGCFAPETQITLADYSYKSISNVSPGDKILTHKKNIAEVLKTYSRYANNVIQINVQSIGTIELTTNHPVYCIPLEQLKVSMLQISTISPIFKRAEDLEIGDLVLAPITPQDNQVSGMYYEGYQCLAIEKVGKVQYTGTVYNLTAEPDNTYVAGGIAVHNSNKNGDYLVEGDLAGGSRDFGYQTFLDAHAFRDHLNKDPKYKVGDVLKAFWNPRMHRVELLIAVYKHRAPEIVQRLDNVGQSGELVGVSFGLTCIFSEGNQILRGDYKYVSPIEIKKGDTVITHLNNKCKVKQVFTRDVKKKVYLKAVGVPEITCTDDHPFFVLRNEKVKKQCKRKDTFLEKINYDFEWVEAKDLKLGDYLVTPINKKIETPEHVNREYARIAGYFLAEGSFVYGQVGNSRKKNRKTDYNKLLGITLAFNLEDKKILDEIIILCDKLKTKNPPRFTYREDNCTVVSIHDADLAKNLLNDIGKGSKEKCLSENVFYWGMEYQKELLGAYIDGDGHQMKDGRVEISTVSSSLAYQLTHLALRNEIMFSVFSVTWKASKMVEKESNGFILQTGSCGGNKLIGYSHKIKKRNKGQPRSGGRFISEDGNWLLTPVNKLEITDEGGTVYNIQVDKDESFIVNTVAVHNCPYEQCSLCGNVNTTRAARCHHLKYEINKTYRDGTKVQALTFKPKFYDISFVWNRANLEALVLVKLASIENKESTVEKKIVTTPSVLEFYRDVARKVVGKITQIEPDLSAEEIRSLAKKPLKNTLGSLSAMGIILKPNEFNTLVSKKANEVSEVIKFSSADQDNEIFDLMLPRMPDRSYYRPFILSRVIENQSALQKNASISENKNLSKLYLLYRDRITKEAKSGNTFPLVALLIALGLGTYYGRKTLKEVPELGKFPHFLEPDSICPISTADIHDKAMAGIIVPSVPVKFRKRYQDLVAGIPASYILSAYKGLDFSEKDVQNLVKDSAVSDVYETEEAAKTDVRIIESIYKEDVK